MAASRRQQPDPATGAIIVPVYQTVNFVFDEIGKPDGYEYSRSANPTRTALEQCLASLEEACFGLAFGSGMAAVDAVLSLLRPGDHVVSSENIYGGTFRLPDGRDQVARFAKGLKLFLFAESLGGVESLVCHPATMSHGGGQ